MLSRARQMQADACNDERMRIMHKAISCILQQQINKNVILEKLNDVSVKIKYLKFFLIFRHLKLYMHSICIACTSYALHAHNTHCMHPICITCSQCALRASDIYTPQIKGHLHKLLHQEQP